MFCAACGKEILSDAKFCPSCGSQVSHQVAPPQQTPVYQDAVNRNTQVPLAKSKEKHITFLFVTSLVFMILFAIRFFSTLGTADDWETLKNTDGLSEEVSSALKGITDAIAFCFVAVALAFAGVLVLFILTSTLKGKKDSNNRAKLAGIIFGFSIVVLIVGVVYMISEIMLVTECKSFLDVAASTANIDHSVMTELESELDSTFSGAMVFNLTFLAFSVANIIKSQQLAKNIKDRQKIEINT